MTSKPIYELSRSELAEEALRIKREQKGVTNTRRMQTLINRYRMIVARIGQIDRQEAEIRGSESH